MYVSNRKQSFPRWCNRAVNICQWNKHCDGRPIVSRLIIPSKRSTGSGTFFFSSAFRSLPPFLRSRSTKRKKQKNPDSPGDLFAARRWTVKGRSRARVLYRPFLSANWGGQKFRSKSGGADQEREVHVGDGRRHSSSFIYSLQPRKAKTFSLSAGQKRHDYPLPRRVTFESFLPRYRLAASWLNADR